MPRQRKYRAYQPSTGKMFYFAPPELEGKDLVQGDNWMVTEWLGFTDQNGKDIYEGDVLQHVLSDPLDSTKPNGSVYKLTYYGYRGWSIRPNSRWTVVGNIYENPELKKLKPIARNLKKL